MFNLSVHGVCVRASHKQLQTQMVFTYLYDFARIFFFRPVIFFAFGVFNTFKYCLYVSFSISTLPLRFTLLPHSHLLFIFNNSFIRILLTNEEFQNYIMLSYARTLALRARGKKHSNGLFQCVMCLSANVTCIVRMSVGLGCFCFRFVFLRFFEQL